MERNVGHLIRNLMAVLALGTASSTAIASTVTVDAYGNSSSGGTGALTGLMLTVGQLFTVTVDPEDLWNAGALPRWSNANGLTGPDLLYGSVSDAEVPTQSPSTVVGTDFGLWNPGGPGGLSAPYGALVGQIDTGAFFLIGASFFNQPALNGGELKLFYWDSNQYDNTGSIQATVSAVPIPAAAWLLLSGLVGFGAIARRKRVATA